MIVEHKISTVVSDSKLELVEIKGSEEMASGFHFTADLRSSTPSLEAKSFLGSPVSVTLSLPDKTQKLINGYIFDFESLGLSTRLGDDKFYQYKALIGPWFDLLKKTRRSQIFQNQSIREICLKIFDGYDFSSVEFQLKNEDSLPYVVQYQESDHNFLCRLFKRYGISFYFQHTSTEHTLVVFDHAGAYQDGSLKLHNVDFEEGPGHLDRFSSQQSYKPGHYRVRSYNPENSGEDIDCEEKALTPYPHQSDHLNEDLFINYLYTGIGSDGSAKELTKAAQFTQRSGGNIQAGASTSLSLEIGKKFSFKNTGETSATEVVLKRLETQSSNLQNFLSSESKGSSDHYKNTFIAIPSDQMSYVESDKTEPPVSKGLQTAVVTGPDGESIYTDKLGRIQVRFHWDYIGPEKSETSCFIRYMSPWAGQGRGWASLPRIGDEVLVAFIDGESDLPVVVGSLFNDTNIQPVKFPEEKETISMRSHSIKGSDDQYNELAMVDTAEAELFRLQAQRDYQLYIKKDRQETVDGDSTLKIQGNSTSETKGNQESLVGGQSTRTIKKSAEYLYDDQLSSLIKKDFLGNIHGKSQLSVKENVEIKSDKSMIHNAGENIDLQAEKKFTITCGSSSISMDSSGSVEIKGVNILINGSKINLGE